MRSTFSIGRSPSGLRRPRTSDGRSGIGDDHLVRIKNPNRFMVSAKRCDQCPFSKNQTTVSDERLQEIKKSLQSTGQSFICHKALDRDLVCRGFYDTEPNLVVRLAQDLGIVEFIPLNENNPHTRRKPTRPRIVRS